MSEPPRGFFRHLAKIREVGDKLSRQLGGSRGHATASATLAGGYVAQLAFQLTYFLILTRMLGPELFGRFAAALAAINLLSPAAGIGYAEVALFRISQDRGQSGLWTANATAVTAAMGLTVALGLALTSALVASDQWIDWHLMLGLAISELVLVRCCFVIARVHQARHEITQTSLINVAIAAVKAMIALSLYFAGRESLTALVILLDLCFSPLLFLLFARLTQRVSLVSVSWTHLWADLRLALSFATGIACKAVYTDLDKLFLARWTTPIVVGTYAAGYKILSLSFTPIRAILEATFAHQVQLANSDRKACQTFTRSLLLLNISLGSVIAAFVFLAAPWLTFVLGDDYRESIGVLRIGFLLPVLQSMHYTLGNYLTAVGRQFFRTIVQLVVLFTYVIAGLIVIPRYSWQGAIWTSLACEALLVLLFAAGCLARGASRSDLKARRSEIARRSESARRRP